jgi:biotin carboxyl carrier protein
MPFVYELMVPEETSQPTYTLTQQLVSAGTLVGTGQNLAVISDGTNQFHLKAPLQGLLVEWLAHSGDSVHSDVAIARVVAEGPEKPVADATPVRITTPC